jgi:hypothetical protein
MEILACILTERVDMYRPLINLIMLLFLFLPVKFHVECGWYRKICHTTEIDFKILFE